MSCPSTNTSAQTSSESPTERLTGQRRQSSIGQTRWIWILDRIFGRVVIEFFGTAPRRVVCTGGHESSPLQRSIAARHFPTRWPTGVGGVSIRRLARRRRANVVAGAAARPPRRRGFAVHGLVCLRSLAGADRLAARPGDTRRGGG